MNLAWETYSSPNRKCVSETRVGIGSGRDFISGCFRNSAGEAYRSRYTYFSNLVARTRLRWTRFRVNYWYHDKNKLVVLGICVRWQDTVWGLFRAPNAITRSPQLHQTRATKDAAQIERHLMRMHSQGLSLMGIKLLNQNATSWATESNKRWSRQFFLVLFLLLLLLLFFVVFVSN